MTSKTDSPTNEPVASRRDFVTAVTVAATAGAAGAAISSGAAQAQAAPVRHVNPPGMTKPAAYSQLVEVSGPHKVVYVAGQTGVDGSGKVAQDFHAQAVQTMENIKTALAAAGAGFEHVVRLTTYMTDLEKNGAAYRDVRAAYFANKEALPASTLLQISRLANPEFMIEVEVTAVVPVKA